MTISVLAGQDLTADALSDTTGSCVEFQSITANTSAVTTTETVGITTDSVTFENGRAYGIALKCLAQSSVSDDDVTLRVRKTNLAGLAVIDQVRVNVPAAAGNAPVYFANVVTNTTGSNIVAPLVATYVRASGTGNVLIVASATSVAYVEVIDRGLATAYPGALAIT